MADRHIAHVADPVVSLGFELVSQYPVARDAVVIVPRIANMRDVDRDVGQQVCQIVSRFTLMEAGDGR
ncbi:hypothetical protein ABID76_004617 [Burkholderia ambifaria]